jgi:DNA invertase Pin-like site-specific DNA recombinase
VVKQTRPVDIYVRVSRVGGREHLISPDEQERRARELATEQALRIGEVLTDLDESGGRWERPGLQEALHRVESGRSGGIIVAWLDRLSRDSEHAHALIRRISDAGGAIYAPDAPSDWLSPEGELQAGIVFAFAQYQRKRARAGFERAKEQAIANGIPVKTRPPVGYRQRSDRHLEPDPDAAPLVRQVFERRAAGAGPAELGAFLTEHGIKTSQGSKTWSKAAVYNLLRNRTYLGELSYGRDRRFVNSSAHEPIVDAALWQAAQRSGVPALAPARSGGNSPFLLTGIARCAACRYCLQATRTSRGKRIYRCTRTRAGGMCPAPTRVAAEAVERAAVEAFWAITKDLEAEGRHDESGDLRQLERDLERADKSLREWASAEIQEAIGDLSEYSAGMRDRRRARDEIVEQLTRLQAKQSAHNALPNRETLAAAWERMNTQERRELVALRFDCLAVRRDGSIIAYAAGSGPMDLPRRGSTVAPLLVGFPDDLPHGARVLALKEAPKEPRHTAVGGRARRAGKNDELHAASLRSRWRSDSSLT